MSSWWSQAIKGLIFLLRFCRVEERSLIKVEVKNMGLFKWANEKVKKLTFIDVKLVAFVGICFGLILAKLIPSILNINIWWFIVIAVLFLSRVYYVMFFKK